MEEEKKNKIESNRSKGRKRVEKYVTYNKYPTEYDDYNSFTHDMSKKEQKCIFCRNTEVMGQMMPSSNHFICIFCKRHMAEVEKGRNLTNRFKIGEDYVLPYFYRNGEDVGWAYLIEIPRVNWHVDYGEGENDQLYSRREYALVAGIRHLHKMLEVYDNN